MTYYRIKVAKLRVSKPQEYTTSIHYISSPPPFTPGTSFMFPHSEPPSRHEGRLRRSSGNATRRPQSGLPGLTPRRSPTDLRHHDLATIEAPRRRAPETQALVSRPRAQATFEAPRRRSSETQAVISRHPIQASAKTPRHRRVPETAVLRCR